MTLFTLHCLVDPHAHFRTPGLEHKEDWKTGSKAAAAGGFAVVLDMPNTRPPLTTEDLLVEKRKTVQNDSLINYGFHFAATVDNLDEIKKVKNKVTSIKIFLNYSTGDLKIEDDKILQKIFDISPVVSCHAEGEMVEKAFYLQKKAGNKLYLCHISLKDEIDFIKRHKNKNIFAEVAPHHLFLTQDDNKNGFFEMYPNLKTKKDLDALWQAIDEGVVDTIGSDHAPHTKEEKMKADFPRGVPGLETSLPLMLNAVNNGKITMEKLKSLMSVNPIKIFNLKIPKSCETIIDMDLEKVVKEENLYTKCGWSPFAGWKLKGWPIKTVVNGVTVYEDNKINDNFRGKEII
ncbi:dihydroorotase [Candidatus Parcubacteria bacterium]|nr:MAG: dihydroorotase [Candidatus Parcubacteria bacterium]